ncbi:unnamed protein product [Cercospora beticola]|nr:unnamed protein product [Cercospora beticola]
MESNIHSWLEVTVARISEVPEDCEITSFHGASRVPTSFSFLSKSRGAMPQRNPADSCVVVSQTNSKSLQTNNLELPTCSHDSGMPERARIQSATNRLRKRPHLEHAVTRRRLVRL